MKLHNGSNKILLRTAFLTVAILGLVLNIYFDTTAFFENRSSTSKGQEIEKAYSALLYLNVLKNEVEAPASDFRTSEIQRRLSRIKILTEGTKFSDNFKVLEAQVYNSDPEALATLNKFYGQVLSGLQIELKDHFTQNQIVDMEMMRAISIDALLIAIMLSLFICNLFAKHKIEQNLKASLNSMRETLMSLEEENFKRQVSIKSTVHDLKNPIGSILGFAQILEDGANSKASVIEFSEMIKKISRRSLDLVESILIREESRKPCMQTVNLSETVAEVCSQLEVQAMQKRQIVTQKIAMADAFICGNKLKIEELIANLLGNAIKYSPQHSPILLVLTATESSYIVTGA